MPAAPLTHHDILELVAPFTRRGRHVDLGASDRLERRLVFQPVDHPVEDERGAIREGLTLESLGTGTCRLTRTLTQGGMPPATLTALGPDPAELFLQMDAVPPRDQFRAGPGHVIARSYSLEPVRAAAAGAAGTMRPIMTSGVAEVDGLRLTMAVPATRRVAAEIQLLPRPGENPELPEDLLAVLGWDWARLIRNADGWKTKRRLRGGPLARTRTAEDALDRAAAHLAATLAAPPSGFHAQWRAARWGVFFRRAIPALTLLGLLIIIALMPHVISSRKPPMFMLLFQIPTALIALSFCLQELPQYEIPPVPRPLRNGHWRRPPAQGVETGAHAAM